MYERMSSLAEQAGEAVAAARDFSFLWSILVPGLILTISIVATLLLYKHFSKEHHG